MGARAQINFRNPVEGVCNGAPQYELFWVNRSGGESRYGSRPCTGHTRSTYVGHLWVWRRSAPQPVETYVEDCSTDADLPKWAFASYGFSGFTVNIACALPESRRIFIVDYFDQRLARLPNCFLLMLCPCYGLSSSGSSPMPRSVAKSTAPTTSKSVLGPLVLWAYPSRLVAASVLMGRSNRILRGWRRERPM